MKKKQMILYYLPFMLLFLEELIMHWKINMNIEEKMMSCFSHICGEKDFFSCHDWKMDI